MGLEYHKAQIVENTLTRKLFLDRLQISVDISHWRVELVPSANPIEFPNGPASKWAATNFPMAHTLFHALFLPSIAKLQSASEFRSGKQRVKTTFAALSIVRLAKQHNMTGLQSHDENWRDCRHEKQSPDNRSPNNRQHSPKNSEHAHPRRSYRPSVRGLFQSTTEGNHIWGSILHLKQLFISQTGSVDQLCSRNQGVQASKVKLSEGVVKPSGKLSTSLCSVQCENQVFREAISAQLSTVDFVGVKINQEDETTLPPLTIMPDSIGAATNLLDERHHNDLCVMTHLVIMTWNPGMTVAKCAY